MRGKQRTHSLAFLCTPLCLFELAEVVTRIKTPGEGPSLQDTMGSDCSGPDGCDRKRPSSSETKSGPRHNSRDTSPLTILPRRCFQTLPHSPLSINRVPLSFPAQPSVCVLKRGLNSPTRLPAARTPPVSHPCALQLFPSVHRNHFKSSKKQIHPSGSPGLRVDSVDPAARLAISCRDTEPATAG